MQEVQGVDMDVLGGDATAGERGTAVGAHPQTAACSQHCMATPCMLLHGCQRAVPVVVWLAGWCRGVGRGLVGHCWVLRGAQVGPEAMGADGSACF